MSDPQTAPTATPTVDINSTPQQIAEAYKAAQVASVAPTAPTPQPVVASPVEPPAVVVDPAAPPTNAPFTLTTLSPDMVELKLATGEVFKGTPLQVAEKVAASKVETTNYAKGLKSELEKVTVAAAARPAITADPNVTVVTDDTRAREQLELQNKYFGSIQEGKLGDATMIGLSQALERSPNEIINTFTAMQNFMQEAYEERVAMSFQAQHPEFPSDSASSQALIEVLGDAPVTVENLQKAHAYCVMNGKYAPLTQEQINASFQGKPPQSAMRRAANPPPPAVTGGNVEVTPAATPANPENVDINMTTDQLRKLYSEELKKQGGRL